MLQYEPTTRGMETVRHKRDGHLPQEGWAPATRGMGTRHKRDGHPPQEGWAPATRGMGTCHKRDGHPPQEGWTPTTRGMGTRHKRDGHPPQEGWTPATRGMDTRHKRDGHPPQEGWAPATRGMDTQYTLHHWQCASAASDAPPTADQTLEFNGETREMPAALDISQSCTRISAGGGVYCVLHHMTGEESCIT